jgi:hypothetical protein
MKDFADRYDIVSLANELDVEVQDLITLERKDSKYQAPAGKIRLQLAVPHANQNNRTEYQAWHKPHNPIRSSWTLCNAWIPENELPKDLSPKAVSICKWITDTRDNNKASGKVVLSMKAIQQAIEKTKKELNKKDISVIWAFHRTITMQLGYQWKKTKTCYMCGAPLHIEDDFCPCGTDNRRTFPRYELFKTEITAPRKIPTVQPIGSLDTMPILETIQTLAQEIYKNTEEVVLEILDYKKEEENKKNKKKNKKNKKNKKK